MFMLAKTWKGEDLTGWYLSEKLDGVRAMFINNKFISRQGNEFIAPPEFTEAVKVFSQGHRLDGELWMGRSMFEKTVGIVKRKTNLLPWDGIKYKVFMAPDMPFNKFITFPWAENPAVVSTVDQTKCKGNDQVDELFDSIVEAGGEGLMARDWAARYSVGRSRWLLKIKPEEQATGTVVNIIPGEGKFTGMIGCLLLADGTKVSGLTDSERSRKDWVGKTIRYKFICRSIYGVAKSAQLLR